MSAIAVGQHLKNIRTFSGSAPLRGLLACGFHGAHIHAVDLVAGNVERQTAPGQVHLSGGTRDRGAHGVTIVLDHVDDRQFPELRHVEALVNLTLIGCAVAEIGDRDVVIAAVTIGKGKTGAERHLRTHNAVTAVEPLLHAEHVHGAALALRIAVRASGQLSHYAFCLHTGRKHVSVIAVAGNDLIALLKDHLHADDYGFLTDVEMAKAANQSHPVHLPCFLFKAADGQHGAIGGELLLLAEISDGSGVGARSFLGDRHWLSLRKRPAIVTGRRWAFQAPNSLNCAAAKARDRRGNCAKQVENGQKFQTVRWITPLPGCGCYRGRKRRVRSRGSVYPTRARARSSSMSGSIVSARKSATRRSQCARSAFSPASSLFMETSCCSRSCCARNPWLPVNAFAAK